MLTVYFVFVIMIAVVLKNTAVICMNGYFVLKLLV